jgi:hypothetical protein
MVSNVWSVNCDVRKFIVHIFYHVHIIPYYIVVILATRTYFDSHFLCAYNYLPPTHDDVRSLVWICLMVCIQCYPQWSLIWTHAVPPVTCWYFLLCATTSCSVMCFLRIMEQWFLFCCIFPVMCWYFLLCAGTSCCALVLPIVSWYFLYVVMSNFYGSLVKYFVWHFQICGNLCGFKVRNCKVSMQEC